MLPSASTKLYFDANGDSYPDLVVSTWPVNGVGKIYLYLGTPAGIFKDTPDWIFSSDSLVAVI